MRLTASARLSPSFLLDRSGLCTLSFGYYPTFCVPQSISSSYIMITSLLSCNAMYHTLAQCSYVLLFIHHSHVIMLHMSTHTPCLPCAIHMYTCSTCPCSHLTLIMPYTRFSLHVHFLVCYTLATALYIHHIYNTCTLT